MLLLKRVYWFIFDMDVHLGGVYYKGSIVKLQSPPDSNASQEDRQAFDPWETITVQWDASKGHDTGRIYIVASAMMLALS